MEKYNALKEMTKAYSDFYLSSTHHSPHESRISLRKRAASVIKAMSAEDFMLDIGSGRQILEKECKQAYGNPTGRFITLDIAQISRGSLHLSKNPRADHIRADGNDLPFGDETISIVVSNMALDFMNAKSISEIYRVMKPGGQAYINLCFSYIERGKEGRKCEELAYVRKADSRYYIPDSEPNFWDVYLNNTSLLITDPKEIGFLFSRAGFLIKRVEKVKGQTDYVWWEIDVYK